MKVVIDTSTLYQALYSSEGASYFILSLVRQGNIKVAISIPVFEEYCDVLMRKDNIKAFELDIKDVKQILDFITLVGMKTDIRYLLRPNLRDENDNMFMELAFASDSRFIITMNKRDFKYKPELKLDEIEVLTPAEFVRMWREEYE